MENVVLTIHLILAALLIGAVLLQRSEGGALGIGGGGGNVMSGRSAATALQKATWGLAASFIATSLVLTWLAVQTASDEGLTGGLGPDPTLEDGSGGGEDLLDMDDFIRGADEFLLEEQGGAPAEDEAAPADAGDEGAAAPADDAAPAEDAGEGDGGAVE